MAKDDIKTRYFPNEKDFSSFEQFDAHRQTLTQQYALEDRVSALEKPPSADGKAVASSSPTSTISGLQVSGSPTANGQSLKWNASTGQIEWS